MLLTKQHIWYNATGDWSVGALAILNTCGRDVVIDKISVSGQECQWTDIYYWKTKDMTITADLNVTMVPVADMEGRWDEVFKYLGS